jgi:hypothetical protein
MAEGIWIMPEEAVAIVGKGIGAWDDAMWYLRLGPAIGADTLRSSCWQRA